VFQEKARESAASGTKPPRTGQRAAAAAGGGARPAGDGGRRGGAGARVLRAGRRLGGVPAGWGGPSTRIPIVCNAPYRHDWDRQTGVFGALLGRVAPLGWGNLGAVLLDPFTRHRTRACRAISAGPAPGAPSLGAPSPTDPPPERPFPGRRPARSRYRARAGSGSTRRPHR